MKILGIVGSNRKDGNSCLLLKETFQGFPDIEAKIVQVAELNIRPCELCFELCAQQPFECVIEDDFRVLFEEMKSTDGIIIACPFYFYVPSRFQPFLERLSCLDAFTEERHGKGLSPLADKPCALICVSASGSTFNAFQILHHLQEFVLMLRMRLVTMSYWPFIGLSARSGEIEKGAILKETKAMEQAKELLRLLVSDIHL